MLSIILVAGVGIVTVQVYRVWTGEPWELRNSVKGPPIYAVQTSADEAPKVQVVSTDVIVNRNIFDPERGEGRSTAVADTSRSYQRVKSMILLGTAIIGNNRVAILQDSPAMRTNPAAASQSSEIMRVKLGDTIEGFQLSEIADRRVVFTKGASRVEVMLDYFRRVENVDTKPPPQPPPQAVPPRPVVPRAVPNLPRRDRLPGAPTPGPES